MTPKSTSVSRRGTGFLATALVAVLCVGALPSCKSSPLVGPVARGQAGIVAQLIDSGQDPNGTDFKGRNVLELAIIKQQTEVVRVLIEKGANVNLVGNYGNLPIAWTGERGGSEIAEILLAAGADPNAMTRSKTPTLYEAIRRGHYDVAGLLIEAGADVNAMGPKSRATALHEAIEKNQPYLVQALVRAGANLNATNKKGRSIKDLASSLYRAGPIRKALEGQLVASSPPKRQSIAREEPKQAAPPPQPVKKRDRTAPTISGGDSLFTRTASVELDLVVKDESAVQDVRVDGRQVVLEPGGRLRMRRSVPEGNSRILITAVDEWGNEASFEVRVARQIMTPVTPMAPTTTTVAHATRAVQPAPISIPQIDFGSYHALVIGINRYSDLPELRTAVNDAISVSAILRDDYEYEVSTLLDATRSDVLRAFQKLRNELTPKDNLLIFYAGHGWLDVDADQGYWLPIDATRNDSVNWISNADITSAVRAIQANHIMLVADSCFSGKLTRGIVIGSKAPNHLERLIQKRARVVLTSGGIEPVEDGAGAHSVFATAFITALRSNRGILEGHELFQQIRRPVMLATDQIPDYGDIRKAGHDGGDFLFVRRRN